MRISLEPAFILHSRPYRESSLIIEFFTQHYGRIALLVRGVRIRKSKIKGLLQPFMPLLISWQGKSDLMTLTSVEANQMPFCLKGKPLLSGFYLNELLIRLLHKDDPYPKLYTIYQSTLLELQHQNLQQKALRLFEKRLLEEIGYGLYLNIKNFKPENFYYFQAELGFRLCSDEFNQAITFSGESLLSFARAELTTNKSLKDAKRLMRLALAPLLGNKPLNSRKLFVEVKSDS